MSFNKIILVGNLGRDPELRYTPQGKAVCSFSMATSANERDKDGNYQEVTTWFKCTTWEKTAEAAAKYLAKGKLAYVEGVLKEQKYNDKDGKERTSLEVNVTSLQFIGPKVENGDTASANTEPVSTANTTPSDDIPF